MERIKIKDLPKPQKISQEEMRKVLGGGAAYAMPYPTLNYSLPHNASLTSGLVSGRFALEPNPLPMPKIPG